MLVVGYAYIAMLARLPSVPLLPWIGFFLIIDFSVAWTRPPGQALPVRGALMLFLFNPQILYLLKFVERQDVLTKV